MERNTRHVTDYNVTEVIWGEGGTKSEFKAYDCIGKYSIANKQTKKYGRKQLGAVSFC
jgi:hypothetical protein